MFFFKLESEEGYHTIRLQSSHLGDSFYIIAANPKTACKQIRNAAHDGGLYYLEVAKLRVAAVYESKVNQTGGFLKISPRPEFDETWCKLKISGSLNKLVGVTKKQQALEKQADHAQAKKMFGTEAAT